MMYGAVRKFCPGWMSFVFFHIDWAALKRINTAIFNVTKNEPRSAESL